MIVTLAQFLVSPIRYFKIACTDSIYVVTPFGVVEVRRKDVEEKAWSEER